MSEIQFLASLLLDESVYSDLKTKLINRIIEIEKTRNMSSIIIQTGTTLTPDPFNSRPFVYNPGPSSQSSIDSIKIY